MVVLGVLLLGVTLKYPPYFDDTTDESNSKRWYQRSGANRLRVAIDLGMLCMYNYYTCELLIFMLLLYG